MKMKNKMILTIIMLTFILVGCGNSTTVTTTNNSTEKPEPVTYEAMLYDNQGNNFLSFEGNSFTISPNKVKQYGWSTDGSWTSYYETSSVMTVEIDGYYIQSCGSTIIFKDTRLTMLDIPSEFNTRKAADSDAYTVTEDTQSFKTYIGLKNWWYKIKEQGQHGRRMILIQSQDGYNIGAFVGNDITWEVAGSLPKTTKIMIDGQPLYIHRCNFTIIDSQLVN